MKPEVLYTVRRSPRGAPSLEITPAGEVLVRAPMKLSRARIEEFVRSRQDWVLAHLEKRKADLAEAASVQPLSEAELAELRARAKEIFARRVAELAPAVGVSWGNITIRFQRSRWGSCSAKGNLNFNALLLLAPPEVLDYVVVHELCHRRELNHSPRFWAEVARVLPDYAQNRAWLKAHGAALMARINSQEVCR